MKQPGEQLLEVRGLYIFVPFTDYFAVWGIPYGVGNGHTKSEAKEAAAQAAYYKLLARG